MEILFLGTGSAFCFQNYQSNLLIKQGDKFLLVDAGGDLRFSLIDANISIQDIDSLYISHLHNDHIGGMEFIALYTYFHPLCESLNLFIHETLLRPLWSNALQAGLNSVQNKVLTLDDYFNVKPVFDADLTFEWQQINFRLIPTQHMHNGKKPILTYGLMFHDMTSDYRVFLTGDTQFIPQMIQDAYNQAHLIIQDCETSDSKTGVHAHYSEILTLDPSIKKKTCLWHYQDNVTNNFDHWNKRAKNDGFKQFIKKGSRLITQQNGIQYIDK